MVTDARRRKAEVDQVKREKQFKVIEEKRIAEVKANEANRKAQIEASKIEFSKIRKDERMGKRRLNIEIASGVADLLIDLAEETFCLQMG